MRTMFLDNVFRTLSWTFIHSLWQGLILVILAGIVMLCTKKAVASFRYALLCSLFFLFLAGVAVTFFMQLNAGPSESPQLTLLAQNSNTFFTHSLFSGLFENITLFLNSNAAWLVSGWLVILFFKAGRLMLDMLYVHRLRTDQLMAPGEEWTNRLQLLSKELGIYKKVTLLQSARVHIPVVLGHFKPVILVPAGVLTNLSAGEIEAVLLHELAHIRRHDYLVNFIQRLAEIVFFFNPGLLWVSSLLRVERENCCDDIAISTTNNKLEFVEALIRFKELSLSKQGYALALFGRKNLLLQRMKRIVYNRNKALSPAEAIFLVLSFFVLLLIIPGILKRKNPALPVAATSIQHYNPPPVLGSSPEKKKGSISQKNIADQKKEIAFIAHDEKTKPADAVNEVSEATEKIKQMADEYVEKGRLKVAMMHEQLVQEVSGEQTTDQVVMAKNQLQQERDELEKSRRQAELDRKQAEKDRQQAAIDRERAEKDRQQAQLNRVQAEKDRQQAYLNRLQADYDREQARKHLAEIGKMK